MARLDHHERYVALMKQLDSCVSSLGFILRSGTTVSGETKLVTFVLETMLVDAGTWAEVSSETINNRVCLHHLESLIRGLDEHQNGVKYKDLDVKYQQALGGSTEDAIQKFVLASSPENKQILLKGMYNLLVKMADPSFEGEQKFDTINEYLVNMVNELDELWFDQFPAIPLWNAEPTYQVVKRMV